MDCKGSKVALSRSKQRRLTRRPAAGISVRTKVRKLQRLIPGGRGLKQDRLLLRTANYILQLRLQVNVLQSLSKFCELES